jgi:hypothetical protein
MEYLSPAELRAGLSRIRESPADGGRLVLIVRRPEAGEREVLAEGLLDPANGLAGDNWLRRGSRKTPDGSADPQRQVTIMNSRVAELVARGPERMPLAGDQLYVDLDLSVDNLPAGTLLTIGEAVLEVSAVPHTGCAKFVERFGPDAMRFCGSRLGRGLRLRGLNALVIRAGVVRCGDLATKSPLAAPRTGGRNERLP